MAGAQTPYGFAELTSLAAHCTEQEDAAKKVERQVRKSAAALFLSDRIGQIFDAMVTGAAEKGTYVRLLQPPVEGKLLNPGRGIEVGDRIRVRLDNLNVERGFIDFVRRQSKWRQQKRHLAAFFGSEAIDFVRRNERTIRSSALDSASHVDQNSAKLPHEPAKSPTDWGKRPPPSAEVHFLRGPQPRRFELIRAIQIFLEIIKGFRALHFVGPCVTVFGSARFREDQPHYQLAREVGSGLAREGFTVMTGGGPGIMEAANRGAKEAGGYSVGCNIELPQEQKPNAYLDRWVTFPDFFVRKVMLVKYSYAFIAMPGGFGTLDEIFETATLIQTGKIQDFPLVLMGKDYWMPLLEFMRGRLLAQKTVDAHDIDRILVTDSAEEAVRCVKDVAMQRFGLTYGPKIKRRWYLGE